MKGYNSRTAKRRKQRQNKEKRTNIRMGGQVTYTDRPHKVVSRRRTNNKVVVALGMLLLAFLLVVLLPYGNPLNQHNEKPTGVAEETVSPSKTANQPKATPTPVPTVATPVPTPRPKAVALTFDDGPDLETTPQLLKILKKYNAHATFFVLGNRVAARAQVVKDTVAAGHEIGNHSWSHANLSQIKMKKVNREIDKTSKVVKRVSGYDVTLVRPPYGEISNRMRKWLKHPMILWSVDTEDWLSKNPKKILREIKKNVKDGSIILMHDIHPTTIKSMNKVCQWLIKNGYDILTVSELMERKGVKVKNGIAYGSIH